MCTRVVDGIRVIETRANADEHLTVACGGFHLREMHQNVRLLAAFILSFNPRAIDENSVKSQNRRGSDEYDRIFFREASAIAF